MDLRERFHDVREIIESIVEAKMASVWTAIPCIVDSVHSSGVKASLQPAIKANVKQPDGSIKQVDMPILQDVPLHFPGGGGVSMTFPVKKGDEALVIFSSRPTDSWKQSGGVQAQIDARMHDLSDGFAIMGFRSSPNALQNVNTDATEIRSDDGSTKISLKGNEVKLPRGLRPQRSPQARSPMMSTEPRFTLPRSG